MTPVAKTEQVTRVIPHKVGGVENEISLITRAKAGDQEALTKLIEMYTPYIATCERNASGDGIDTNELRSRAINAIPALVRNFDTKKSQGRGLRPALAKTIQNIQNSLHREKTNTKHHLRDYAYFRSATEAGTDSSSDAPASLPEDIKSFLNEGRLQVIELTYGVDLGSNPNKEHLNDIEIAERLGISPVAVRKRRSLAIRTLQGVYASSKGKTQAAA